MKCGLLGKKLGHSYSPLIHSYLGSYPYELFEVSPENLGEFLKYGDFSGINVTMPYKKDVIPFCRELSDRARELGAVNTIVRQPDGSLLGHNTDYFGFETILHQSGISVSGKKVLVLGSGGASNTAVAALKHHGAKTVVISRSGENHYQNLHLHKDAAMIVNATPVGMYPNNGECPVDISLFPELEGVLDLIYNPARTQLLLDAEARGIVAMNGLLMLVAQAKEASEWFTGQSIPNDAIPKIYQALVNRMENIILIGMPGSGKTTIGDLLSQRTGMPLLDADACIVEKAGRPIPEIFAADGEAGFRKLETEVLRELCKQSGLIISTGGGCVTREENYPLLHQNGRIICLDRALDLLPTEGRPLSQITKLEEMYKVRLPMYQRFADHWVDNNGAASDTVNAILNKLEMNV